MRKQFSLVLTILAGITLASFAQVPTAFAPDPNMARVIDPYNSVFMEELTWLDIRDALKAGKKTVIIATGGVEQNGPYLATGKHNYVLKATTEAIAKKLGNALVAPIVPFVPEGSINPPEGHMLYPGTISVSLRTFKLLLTDIAASMKVHGFKHIVLIGDSGGNQAGMKAVADSLSKVWDPSMTTIHFIPEYYTQLPDKEWLAKRGIVETDEGLHDDYVITATIMTVDPRMVRMNERIKAGKFSINGVPLSPADKAIKVGEEAVTFRANVTASAIQLLIGK